MLDVFCLDVDGVMTDGKFLYSSEGKVFKSFGADDADALAVLRNFVDVRFVTADHRGWPITEARIHTDMGFRLDLVPAAERLGWLSDLYSLARVAYMGDSFLDRPVLAGVGLGIAPSNASPRAKEVATFVTDSAGGNGAVAEASFFIAEKIGAKPVEFDL